MYAYIGIATIKYTSKQTLSPKIVDFLTPYSFWPEVFISASVSVIKLIDFVKVSSKFIVDYFSFFSSTNQFLNYD